MDNLDLELFIGEIEKRPSLWDSSSDDYKNRQLKGNDWKEVCENIIDNFNEKDDLEQQAISKAVQVKWKSLRDAFIRSIRQAKGKKTYVHAKQLGFLRKVMIDSNQTERSLPSTSRESQGDTDVSNDPNDLQSTPSYVENTELDSQRETGRTRSRSDVNRRKKSSLESKLLKYIDSQNRQLSVIQSQPQETDDMAFFRSLQPSLDILTLNDKLNFRIEVMELLGRHINKQPNRYTHNFTNHIPRYQPQQYPVRANHSNKGFSTPIPSPASYPIVSSEITPHLPTTYTIEPLIVTSPQPPSSPTESEDSIISQAESLISLF
ncbi:uncharacterized protein LOC114331031 [Diabrotica virgifera virgifera]|uniref:Uncharacterized protein LOC114331031 n=1 Tax=Diabrotica virgifera virgifera TaxID=50390 RepID=A0A6P7FTL4_DIAVI|nr:uncharacterized protein LOC114331031 [Diabrotica virgifera virgifera]XP_028136293.1 uncharacterized protein LOC114331031 [Diabrotica virgifera virgifera]XP_050512020.1 uncharacterized protein LOC114331031 [Diabrotica virgifera virgifera]XP_050512021.1 uncharacterized protein LOC114331031 [Diabrotica virgifera virgifera]XP_050512022.1 uncharacterized protein LOC114331031 [Diabrotica virgifera virgifera]XP_050512023.1 uncharacterized protein LOC114331031 [Diabrotica virgifera virgifera]XP_05